MTRALAAITLNGFREARRNRVTVVVIAFAVATLCSSVLVTQVTVHTLGKVLIDFGLGVMALMLSFLAIFLSTGLISREIERRTIFLTLGKPLSRTVFLLGRIGGNLVTLLVLQAMMVALYLAQLALFRTPFTEPQLAAILGLSFEVLLLTTLGVLFSATLSQTVAAVATTGFFFLGHLSGDLFRFVQKSDDALLRFLGKGAYYVLPNLERVNFRLMASHGDHVPLSVFLSGAAATVAYAVGLFVITSLFFERRDFK